MPFLTRLREPDRSVCGKEDMEVFKAGLVVAIAAILASAGACEGSSAVRTSGATVPIASDGALVSGCAMRVRDELEPGLGSRAVRVGPAAFVPFRVNPPREPRAGAVGNFKVMVELRPGARVTIRLPSETTGQLSLLFDRGRTRKDNAYTLAEGTRAVRFETCPGKPTTFVGAIATAGATKAPLDVTVEGHPTQRIELLSP